MSTLNLGEYIKKKSYSFTEFKSKSQVMFTAFLQFLDKKETL